MTYGDILFFAVFVPLAALAAWRSSRGEGVEIPNGRQLSALAVAGLLLAVVVETAVWILTLEQKGIRLMKRLLQIIISAILGGQMRETEDWLDWLENQK